MEALDFVRAYNTMPVETCKSLIKYFKKVNYTYHEWQDENGKSIKLKKNRKGEIKNYMMEKNEQNTLIPFITKALLKYYDEIFSLYPYLYLYNNQQIVKKLSRFRVNRYDTKTNMALHIDNIHNIFDGKEKGVPILSIVGLLNDNFKGGEFYVSNKKIVLKQGDVLILPSNFIYPHEVKLITQGSRYSFITWGY